MNLREAAEKALETLEYLAQREHPQTNIVTKTHRIFPHRMMTEAAKELRAALAEPKPEPAAWGYGYRSITTGQVEWQKVTLKLEDRYLRDTEVVFEPLYARGER